MSANTTVKAANWRFVEVGRVVLTQSNELAAIVEIIDQKRVLIDGPKVKRQAISLGRVVLTQIVLEKLPRGAKSVTVHKKWAAAEIDQRWAKTAWAQKIANRQRRAELTDFERFQVMILKKQRRFAVQRAAKAAQA